MDDKKRHHIRFHADDNCLIDLKFEDGRKCTGLALSESLGGCGGIFVKKPEFQKGMTCHLNIGDFDQLEAVVRYIEDLNEEVIKVGFEYLKI